MHFIKDDGFEETSQSLMKCCTVVSEAGALSVRVSPSSRMITNTQILIETGDALAGGP
jgi:hypothetical protein